MLWLYTSRQAAWAIFIVGVALLLAGLGARYGWKNSPVGQLAWDGQLWRWESAVYQTGVAEQQLFVIADFQHLLLLRIENRAHASLWLWAERRAFPGRWMDLRRAVYCPKRPESVHTQALAARNDEAGAAAAMP
jgi:toxin CptA